MAETKTMSESEENPLVDAKVKTAEVIDPLVYTRPTVNGVIDPLAYAKPPKEEMIDPLLYTRTLADGTVDPFVYTKPPVECFGAEPKTVISQALKKECKNGYKNKTVIRIKEKAKLNKRMTEKEVGEKIDQKTSTVKATQELGMVKPKSLKTNVSILPVERQIYIDREGNEVPDREEIESVVYINKVPYPFTIKVKEISSMVKRVQQRYAEAIIDHRERNAPKVIEGKFRDEVRRCPKKFIYFEQGWQQIRGVNVYVRDGLNIASEIEINTGVTLPAISYSAEMLRDIWERSMCTYMDGNTIAVIFAFSLMGVLYRLFKEAGYTPHFTLFLYGKTGSMKTTVAKIFYTQLCEERYRDSVRRIDADTEVSLERAVVLTGYDAITLIDDFSPAKTARKKREMTDKLEMIVRMVGDGSSRSRSSMKLDDRRGEGVQGMVALTGELLGKGLSSNLRCFYCKMEREKANENMITWFQNNKYAYTTLIAAFADFVGTNYKLIVDFIRNSFGEERKKISQVVKEYRIIDSTAMLCIALDIFARFLTRCCRMSENEAERRISEMKKGILDCAVISEELSTEESPSDIFIEAIAALLRTGHIRLCAEKRMLTEVETADGFEDENFLHFNPDVVHKKVAAFLRQTNRYFPYDLKEVLAMLADDRIIQTASNGQGKRTYCARVLVGNGHKYNFMKIRKVVFNSVINGVHEV